MKKKYVIDCKDCYTEMVIEIIDGSETEIVCCPCCSNTKPDIEELEEDE